MKWYHSETVWRLITEFFLMRSGFVRIHYLFVRIHFLFSRPFYYSLLIGKNSVISLSKRDILESGWCNGDFVEAVTLKMLAHYIISPQWSRFNEVVGGSPTISFLWCYRRYTALNVRGRRNEMVGLPGYIFHVIASLMLQHQRCYSIYEVLWHLWCNWGDI